MKAKILSVFLLTVILSVIAVSAVDLISISKGPVFTESNSETYFDITGLQSSNIVMPASVLRIDDGKNNFMTLTLNPTTLNQALTAGSRERVTATLLVDSNFNFQIRTYTFPMINITATGSNSTTDSKTVSLEFQKTFCKSGENGTDLSMSRIDINNQDGDDFEWKPLDHIKIDVRVDNDGDEKIRDVIVELGLIDSDGKDIAKDLENLDDRSIDLGSINDGDDKTATFEFDVPVDFEDDRYSLVLKAYSDDLGEDGLCISSSSDLESDFYQVIDGIREDDEDKQIVLYNIRFSPSTAQCSDRIQVTADVVNIGDEDYEDQVKVTLFNSELGINEEVIIREDFDIGDSFPIDFEFDIPQDAKEKSYGFELRTYYDYDSRSDSYDIQSEERFIQFLTVQGNCAPVVTTPSLRISAELDSQTPDAIAGREVIINAQLRNTGTETLSWLISTIGNSAWSSLVSIDPQTLTLTSGQSANVVIRLNIDTDIQGDQEFTIRATSGDQVVEQRVALSVSSQQASVNAFTQHLRQNWFIYLIVLVNIILIIAIIAVIRRMMGPSSREYQ